MISKDLIGASATPLILAILRHQESYGYAIIKRVRQLSGEHITWTDGMLYPVLHRLERQGLIAAVWRTADTGRKRKYYSLTEAGEQMLAREKAQWMLVHSTLGKLWKDVEAAPSI